MSKEVQLYLAIIERSTDYWGPASNNTDVGADGWVKFLS